MTYKYSKNNQSGFTIVELLIIVVVIGILAIVSIVSYSGVQQRARTAENQTGAAQVVEVAESISNTHIGVTKKTAGGVIYVQNGGYPMARTTAEAGTNYIGFDKPAEVKMPSNIIVVSPALTARPSVATAKLDMAKNPKQYRVKYCGSANGLRVYYFDEFANKVESVVAGECSDF